MNNNSNFNQVQVGDFKVTMLSDGFFPMTSDVFPAVDEDGFQACLKSADLEPGIYESAVNAFVIDNGKDIHLIDAGGAGMVDSLGKLNNNLAAAGYNADQIKSLIVTHLHPDHIGGATINGEAAFPNAEMIVSQADHAFWTSADIRAGAPDDAKPFFDMAVGAVNAYSDRLRLFKGEADIITGVTAVELPGHTPGHCGFTVSSGNETLMIWADVVHMQFLQFDDPSIAIVFDTDPEQAAATRKKVLDQVSTDGLRIAGSHLRHPGIGHVEKFGSGYRLVQE